jgi:DNA-binding FadR family transcriptional regulator
VNPFLTVLASNKHEMVAMALEKAILSGQLKIGEKLPSEQSLAGQFGVSRNIVREALRDVKARGLLEVKNGAGSYIASPTSTDLGDMLNRFIVLGDTAIDDYYEIRYALEVKACELAAVRATKEDLDGLEAIARKMEKSLRMREDLTELDFDFHFAIAKATKNPLFSSLLQPLKSVMTYVFNRGYSPLALEEAVDGHVRIVAALREKNPELARTAMTRHIAVSESNLAHLGLKGGASQVGKAGTKKSPKPRSRSSRSGS